MKLSTLSTALLLLVACKDAEILDPDPVGPRNHVWPDVPIAQGMDYKSGEGTVRPDGGLRVYRMELRGGLRLEELLAWYKDVMPKDPNHWKLMSEKGSPPNPVTLIFEKGVEKLTMDLKNESVHETVALIKIDYRR